MKIQGKYYRTIWEKAGSLGAVCIIDQRRLPFELAINELVALEDYALAIEEMQVRGAPLIGATAAYGLYRAALDARDWEDIEAAAHRLRRTRPTAVDLFHAIDRVMDALAGASASTAAALAAARALVEESVEQCRRIGEHGLPLIAEISRRKGGAPVNVLTHCNAGWLACVDYGTITAPIYLAHDSGIAVHVWVDETRPRNQGARLTAYELGQHGVPHTVIVDNAGGLLMQKGMVDLVLVGADRVTRAGDVANKIGTYLKALAAHDNGVPFYVAVPANSIDWRARDGLAEIVIEKRDADEVGEIEGWDGERMRTLRLTPLDSPALNYGFDVTPARLVSALITDRGCCPANEEGLSRLFPERRGDGGPKEGLA
jgi:methylthioribose-1-phosphate isomerase